MINVLAIMGSPHKGESSAHTEKIELMLKDLGDVNFNYVYLKDTDLKPCRGCFACFLKGKNSCPLKDEKEAIEKKIDDADGVIFVTPVYSMHVSYLMKQFIDRFSYNFHRPRYFGKYAIAVATTGNIGLKETLGYLKGVAMCWGFEFIGEVGVIKPPRPLPLLSNKKDNTEKVIRKFYTAMEQKQQRRLTFIDHLMFHSMKSLYSRLNRISPVPMDYTYWNEKGMFEKGRNYFVKARTNVIGNLAAKALTLGVGRQADKALPAIDS